MTYGNVSSRLDAGSKVRDDAANRYFCSEDVFLFQIPLLEVLQMHHKATASGFSLIELLVSMAIILILLTAVCAAIIQVLKIEAVHAGRASMGRSASQLAARLQEDARSSTAVFIPSSDVLGNANGGTNGAHEVDFFRKLSAGGETYVAYRFDELSN